MKANLQRFHQERMQKLLEQTHTIAMAIDDGYNTAALITKETGLKEGTVRDYLRRMTDEGDIIRSEQLTHNNIKQAVYFLQDGYTARFDVEPVEKPVAAPIKPWRDPLVAALFGPVPGVLVEC